VYTLPHFTNNSCSLQKLHYLVKHHFSKVIPQFRSAQE
jgi:hypothetical protein